MFEDLPTLEDTVKLMKESNKEMEDNMEELKQINKEREDV